jgi:hypothetical protein
MAEKELRKEIEEITGELEEIKGELAARFAKMKKLAKPALLVLAGLIGLKIALKVMGILFKILWKMKLVILIAGIVAGMKLYQSQNKQQCCS